jgi:hypothetical protein
MLMDPVRETPKPHQCVCLLIKRIPGPLTLTQLQELAANRGSFQDVVKTFREIKDKCHAVVDNPDQAFCESCEASGHPHDPEQIGLNNITKEME